MYILYVVRATIVDQGHSILYIMLKQISQPSLVPICRINSFHPLTAVVSTKAFDGTLDYNNNTDAAS